MADFSLPDCQGARHQLYGQTNARAMVLIFTSTGCPIIQKSIPKINALRKEFESRGVVFWLVNSNAQDDPASVADEARDFKMELPVLLDRSQAVARALGATRTAEVFCIGPKSWSVFYRGAIDDRLGYGTEKPEANHDYLRDALSAFLSGNKIALARTEAKGCRIQVGKTKS